MFYTDTVTYRSAEQLNTAMAGVYKHMALATAVSGLIAWWVSATPALLAVLFGTELKWLIIFAPLAVGLLLGFTLQKVSKTTAYAMLYGFAGLMGLSLSTLFAAYTALSIVSAFSGAAVLFTLLSGWGYFTRQDLSGWGKILLIAVIAIVITSVINIFLGSTLLQTIVSALGVLVFSALTAYDTQRIREELSVNAGGNAEVGGALSLYLNFINIFVNLLQLFGNRE